MAGAVAWLSIFALHLAAQLHVCNLMSVCRALKEKKTGSHGYTAAGSTEGQQNAKANGAVSSAVTVR